MKKQNLGKQIDKLAEYLMENFPDQIRGEGAIDTAIDILRFVKLEEDGRKALTKDYKYIT